MSSISYGMLTCSGEQSAVLFTAKCLLASVAVMLIPQEIIMCLIFAYQTYVFCMTVSMPHCRS